MIVILGYDGLEYNYVVEFKCKELMQERFGKTDISMFTEPRTVVIWSSFLTGRNTEKDALKDLWNFRVKPEETFFAKFKKWHAIDVPGFTHISEMHAKEREMMKKVFEGETSVEEYDKLIFENHRKVKEMFFEALEKDYDILMGYFSLADSIGHVSFGLKIKMKLIYRELEKIARKTKDVAEKVFIISDHGMQAVGRFGDHSNYGFWSFSKNVDLGTPKVTELKKFIESLA